MSIHHVTGRVRQLAGRDIHNHQHGAAAPPPEGARHAMTCPQCGGRTWRHSRHCVHCMLDLWAWRASQAFGVAGQGLQLVALAVLAIAAARLHR